MIVKKNLKMYPYKMHNDELGQRYFQQEGATAHTTAFLYEFFDHRLRSIYTQVEFSPNSRCVIIMEYFCPLLN